MLGALLYAIYMGERRFIPSDAVVTLLAVVLCIATDVMFLRIIDALVKKKRLEEQQLQKVFSLPLRDQSWNPHILKVNSPSLKNQVMAQPIPVSITIIFQLFMGGNMGLILK